MENDISQYKYKNFLKTTMEWVFYILIFFAIIWGAPKLLVRVLDTDYPIASITSGSMWPALKQDDIVFIRGYSGDKNELNIGDIVVYQNNNGFTIHRIIELEPAYLVTKGDANNVEDPAIKYDQLVGKMLTINGQPLRIPWLGGLSQAINHDNT